MNRHLMLGLTVVVALFAVACGGGATSMAAPSSLQGTKMNPGFHLTWKDNSNDEMEFVVERRVGTADFSELARVPFDTTQLMVQSGEAGVEHRFRVRAAMESMLSEPSNDVVWIPE